MPDADHKSGFAMFPSPNFKSTATSGLELIGGFGTQLLEPIAALQVFFDAANIYDFMRRGNSTIEAMLRSLEMPIIRAKYVVEPASDTPDDVEAAAYITHNLLERLNWSHYLENSTTFQQFGNSQFQSVYEVGSWTYETADENGAPVSKVYKNCVLLAALDYMAPKTMFQYLYSDKTNRLDRVKQLGYWIENGQTVYKAQDISTDFLHFIIRQQRGGNYNGVSILRPCYMHYIAINALYKIQMVAIARNASGVPIMEEPEGGASDEDRTDAATLATALRMYENSGVTIPHGWKLTFADGRLNLEACEKAIVHHRNQILLCALTQFLTQGLDGSTGSRNASQTHEDFLEMTLWAIGEQIVNVLNHTVVAQLMFYKYGALAKLPRLKLIKLGGDDATSWVNTYGNLIQQGALQWYPEGEDAIIDAMELPPKTRALTPDTEEEVQQASDVTEGAAEAAPTAHAGGQMHRESGPKFGYHRATRQFMGRPSSTPVKGSGASITLAEPNVQDVAVIAVIHDNCLLMGRRRDTGKWTTPGGHMNPGESPRNGAQRELLEETGIGVQSALLKPLCTEVVTGKGGQLVRVHAFRLDVDDRVATSMQDDPDKEVTRWTWVPFDRIPSESDLHAQKNVILKALGLQDWQRNAQQMRALNYNPDQPRDADGKWGTQVGAAKKKTIYPYLSMSEMTPPKT